MAQQRFTAEDVKRYARLAKVRLLGGEEARLAVDLGSILDYFTQIQEVETGSVEPAFHVVDVVNAFRLDEEGRALSSEEALANAPRSAEGYFKSPKAF